MALAEQNDGMSDEPNIPARKRWIRGIVAALALSLLCQAFATYWVVSSLSGLIVGIQKPYNELWYAMAVNAPAAIFWFWYFSRPKRNPDRGLIGPRTPLPNAEISRWGDGMSQRPRSQRKWLHRAVAAVIVLASYYTVHRATCHYEYGWKHDDLGHARVRVSRRQHRLTNGPFPRWAEAFFQPASQFDELIGLGPYQRPTF
jgi:hypothetical protein